MVTLSVFDDGQCLHERCAVQMIGPNRISCLAKIICDKLISSSRPDDFDEINHMWVFDIRKEIASKRKSKTNHAVTDHRWKRIYDNAGNFSGFGPRNASSGTDSIDDENTKSDENMSSHGPVLASLGLTVGTLLRFSYDMGDPIIYNLRVVDISPLVGDSSKYPALMPHWLSQGYLCSKNLEVVALVTLP